MDGLSSISFGLLKKIFFVASLLPPVCGEQGSAQQLHLNMPLASMQPVGAVSSPGLSFALK